MGLISTSKKLIGSNEPTMMRALIYLSTYTFVNYSSLELLQAKTMQLKKIVQFHFKYTPRPYLTFIVGTDHSLLAV